MKSIKVKSFDVLDAKEELKKCPRIIRDYVRVLEDTIERQKDLINKTIKRIEELSKSE